MILLEVFMQDREDIIRAALAAAEENKISLEKTMAAITNLRDEIASIKSMPSAFLSENQLDQRVQRIKEIKQELENNLESYKEAALDLELNVGRAFKVGFPKQLESLSDLALAVNKQEHLDGLASQIKKFQNAADKILAKDEKELTSRAEQAAAAALDEEKKRQVSRRELEQREKILKQREEEQKQQLKTAEEKKKSDKIQQELQGVEKTFASDFRQLNAELAEVTDRLSRTDASLSKMPKEKTGKITAEERFKVAEERLKVAERVSQTYDAEITKLIQRYEQSKDEDKKINKKLKSLDQYQAQLESDLKKISGKLKDWDEGRRGGLSRDHWQRQYDNIKFELLPQTESQIKLGNLSLKKEEMIRERITNKIDEIQDRKKATIEPVVKEETSNVRKAAENIKVIASIKSAQQISRSAALAEEQARLDEAKKGEMERRARAIEAQKIADKERLEMELKKVTREVDESRSKQERRDKASVSELSTSGRTETRIQELRQIYRDAQSLTDDFTTENTSVEHYKTQMAKYLERANAIKLELANASDKTPVKGQFARKEDSVSRESTTQVAVLLGNPLQILKAMVSELTVDENAKLKAAEEAPKATAAKQTKRPPEKADQVEVDDALSSFVQSQSPGKRH